MTTKIIQKNICLMDGTKIKIDINIPLHREVEVNEERDAFGENLIVEQILRGLKGSIKAYKNSELPNKFLYPQKFIVTNELPLPILGVFLLIGDDIYVEADTISNIRRTRSAFLLGHEMGHKISKYTDTIDAYYDIARAFDMLTIDNKPFLEEMYANICGLIVNGDNDVALPHLGGYYLNEVLPEDHCEHLKRQVLKSIYHV